ncbi:MAG: helix-turn-helix transcriptional regulator [Sphingomonas sp.]|nr:helix-turn-helix transcriptional regulator [Sphingomonas sp.]
MANPKLDMLTERERACLRLVARGHSSKEIGGELGISHHTVDLYLKRAIKALEANDRRDAARQLESHELSGNQGLATQPPELAVPPAAAVISSPIRMESPSGFALPFLRNGRRLNDLTSIERLVWIFVIAFIILFVLANFLNGLSAIHQLAV